MEELFDELGIDMQQHLQLLYTLDLDQLAAEVVRGLLDLVPLAGGGSWEL